MAEREHLVYAAHASAYHCFEADGPANHAHAEHLIARATIQAGFPRIGLHHAERCLEWCEQHRDAVEDWDVAFAYEALARGHAAFRRRGGSAQGSRPGEGPR